MKNKLYTWTTFKLSILLILLLVLIFGCGSNDQDELNISPEAETAIRQSLQDNNFANIIVGLSDVRNLSPDLSDTQKSELIDQAQQKLLLALDSADLFVDNVKVFTLIPHIAFTITNIETLNFLISSTLVYSIEEDFLVSPI